MPWYIMDYYTRSECVKTSMSTREDVLPIDIESASAGHWHVSLVAKKEKIILRVTIRFIVYLGWENAYQMNSL